MNLIETTEKEIKQNIRDCQRKGHQQQVAYSTYEEAFTQICFTCKLVRTNIIIIWGLK